MRKFQFRFTTILNVRKRSEEAMLQNLAVAQRAFQAERQKKIKLLQELETALIRRESLAQIATGIVAYRTEQDFIVGTKSRIVWADQAILRATRGVEKALRGYLGARRQTRTIELIREKDFLEFKKALIKREQKELDELMIMRNRLRDNPQNDESEVEKLVGI